MKVSVDVQAPRWYSRLPRAVRRGVVIATVMAVASVPVGVLASHDFADVPDSNTHHAAVSAAKDAGIAAGFGDGSFRPNESVTRGQMTTFLKRGLPSVWEGAGYAQLVNGNDNWGTLASTSVTAPGVPGPDNDPNWQYLKVDASVDMWVTDPWGCPCGAGVRLVDLTNNVAIAPFESWATLHTDDQVEFVTGYPTVHESLSVTGVIKVRAGSTREIAVTGVERGSGGRDINAIVHLTVLSTPFGMADF